MATTARETRQSVQFFDVDIFRNKLENYMRKQAHEMYEPVNNKKRKFSDRFDDLEKEEMELSEDYREDLCWQFNKRQRYYPLDDEELDMEEVSPLALPSPVSVNGEASGPWPFLSHHQQQPQSIYEDVDPMAMAMRRQISGYSEASALQWPDMNDDWMSACPPLSRGSLSYTCSAPDTPNHGGDTNSETYMADIESCNALHATSFDNPKDDLDLDLNSMAPHERNLLAALAPERFEKAALIKKAFRQSDKLLDQFASENRIIKDEDEEQMQMDDGEYDQVFGELMHV